MFLFFYLQKKIKTQNYKKANQLHIPINRELKSYFNDANHHK